MWSPATVNHGLWMRLLMWPHTGLQPLQCCPAAPCDVARLGALLALPLQAPPPPRP